jgi:hypothetical protein
MAGAYQSQLSPGGQSSFSGAPAEGLAAPIAGALEYGGELMDREIHQRRELDRDMQASAAGVELARASSDLDKAAIDARTNASPGGAGHTDSISQMVDGRAQQALGEIRDPRVRQIFTQHWENLKSEIGTREYGWEAGQRVAFQVNNMKEIGRLGAADMAADPDPTKLPGKIANLNAAVDAQTSIDADTKTQLKRELAAPMVFGMANAIADQGSGSNSWRSGNRAKRDPARAGALSLSRRAADQFASQLGRARAPAPGERAAAVIRTGEGGRRQVDRRSRRARDAAHRLEHS